MKTTLTGVHGSGKSTLYNELEKVLTNYTFITSPTRGVISMGLTNLSESSNEINQAVILGATISRAFIKGNTVEDRFILDTVAYTHYLWQEDKVGEFLLNAAINALNECYTKYDKIFYIAPEFELVADKYRSSNVEFRDRIWKIYEYYIAHYNLPVIRLTGTVEQRLKTIYGEIK